MAAKWIRDKVRRFLPGRRRHLEAEVPASEQDNEEVYKSDHYVTSNVEVKHGRVASGRY